MPSNNEFKYFNLTKNLNLMTSASDEVGGWGCKILVNLVPSIFFLLAGPGPVLARGLPQVRLLWREAGRGGPLPLHQGQPAALQEGLPQVGRDNCVCQPSIKMLCWTDCSGRRATALRVTRWSPPSRWWWGRGPTCTTSSASPASSADTGEFYYVDINKLSKH